MPGALDLIDHQGGDTYEHVYVPVESGHIPCALELA